MMPSFYTGRFVWYVGGRWHGYRFTRCLDGYEVQRPDGTYLDTVTTTASARRLIEADELLQRMEQQKVVEPVAA